MIVKKKKVVVRPKYNVTAATKYVRAALDDEAFDDADDEVDGIMDSIDDVADTVEDLQDSIDEVADDDVQISVNNNIGGHYIAECDQCNGIFISAVVESDQQVDSVSGVCPLCGKETEQYLKWLIQDVK